MQSGKKKKKTLWGPNQKCDAAASNRCTTNLSAFFTLVCSFLLPCGLLKGSLRQPLPAFLKTKRETDWLSYAVTEMVVGASLHALPVWLLSG